MQFERYLECLATDAARLRDVAARDLTKQVPSCPEWNVADLVRHTASVYLHKVEGMRRGGEPDEWPPTGVNEEEPLTLFDRAYVDLMAEFDKRDPADETGTWYDADQTVGFWIRRMAQETVIHRVDAELALREPIAEIPDDLAVDGVDEVLVRFLAYIFTKWAGELTEQLKDADGRGVLVRADGSSWLVRATNTGVTAEAGGGESGATVLGKPHNVLLWLWRRADDDAITVEGDAGLVAQLRELLGPATQ